MSIHFHAQSSPESAVLTSDVVCRRYRSTDRAVQVSAMLKHTAYISFLAGTIDANVAGEGVSGPLLWPLFITVSNIAIADENVILGRNLLSQYWCAKLPCSTSYPRNDDERSAVLMFHVNVRHTEVTNPLLNDALVPYNLINAAFEFRLLSAC